MSRALVLGATGHIGAHVVRALLAEGHSVRAAYRGERFLDVLEGLPVERARVDLEEPGGLREALAGCEWVFHAAGYYPGPREEREQAVEKAITLTRRVLGQIRQAGPRRVVFTSSAATLRGVPGRPANEEDAEPWPLERWRHLYSTVKIAMEQEALAAHRAGLPVVIVNPTLCIGEYDARPFSGRAVLAFARRRQPWYVETCFNVVYTGDVGLGHLRAAEAGRLGERYLLAGHNVSLKEFAEVTCRLAGMPPPRWRLPYAAAWVSACLAEAVAAVTGRDPLFTRDEVRRVRDGYPLDGSKAFREFGLPRTSVEVAVRRALDWFRKNGVLADGGKRR